MKRERVSAQSSSDSSLEDSSAVLSSVLAMCTFFGGGFSFRLLFFGFISCRKGGLVCYR